MRIGIDVGGTNTDAVLMDGTDLIAQVKSPTTADITSGILTSIESVIKDGPKDTRNRLQAVMLGTTHFTNALLEKRGLSTTAVLRLCLPAYRSKISDRWF
jgi:N-methylhydantoinase A/oxoprolinase/acetone carboxylase beta subunit